MWNEEAEAERIVKAKKGRESKGEQENNEHEFSRRVTEYSNVPEKRGNTMG